MQRAVGHRASGWWSASQWTESADGLIGGQRSPPPPPTRRSTRRHRDRRRARALHRGAGAQQPALDGPLAHLQGGGDLAVPVAGDLERRHGALAPRQARDELERRARVGGRGRRRGGGVAPVSARRLMRRSCWARRIASRRATTRSESMMLCARAGARRARPRRTRPRSRRERASARRRLPSAPVGAARSHSSADSARTGPRRCARGGSPAGAARDDRPKRAHSLLRASRTNGPD
jgi:hypothetical protein